LFELYTLAGKHEEGLYEAVDVGAGGGIGVNWTRRGGQVGAELTVRSINGSCIKKWRKYQKKGNVERSCCVEKACAQG